MSTRPRPRAPWLLALSVCAVACASQPTVSPSPPETTRAPALASGGAAPAELVHVRAAPSAIYWIERPGNGVNFDFLVENQTKTPLELDRIEISALDREGHLLLRRYTAKNGPSGGIFTVLPTRTFAPGRTGMFYSPFSQLEADMEIATLRYTLTFGVPGSEETVQKTVEVAPIHFTPRTPLILPLRGRMIVHDGSDYYAHHRRVDYTSPFFVAFGIHDNPTRYAVDLCPVDERGAIARGDGLQISDFIGLGQEVYAAGAGRVAAARDGIADNEVLGRADHLTKELIKEDPMNFGGNHVVIDHENGEYSLYAHLQSGSVRVKTGDRVEQGKLIGRLGDSGDANLPHLHFEMRSTKDIFAAGIPAHFNDFFRVLGAKRVPVREGPLESGEIVER